MRLVLLAAAARALDVYPPTPGDVRDASARLTVADVATPLVVERGSPIRGAGAPPLPSSRARWATDEPCACVLALPGADLGGATLRAAGRDLATTAENETLAFILDRPDHYVLRVAGRRFYFWVDATEATRPPADATVFAPDASRPAGWLEAALTEGAVALAAGAHASAPVSLPGNATLFLMPGAVTAAEQKSCSLVLTCSVRREDDTSSPTLQKASKRVFVSPNEVDVRRSCLAPAAPRIRPRS